MTSLADVSMKMILEQNLNSEQDLKVKVLNLPVVCSTYIPEDIGCLCKKTESSVAVKTNVNTWKFIYEINKINPLWPSDAIWCHRI